MCLFVVIFVHIGLYNRFVRYLELVDMLGICFR